MVGILQADIFTNKTALITGAASGIGRGLALHAAKLQMNVVLMDLNADGLSETHSLMTECPSMEGHSVIRLWVSLKPSALRSIKTTFI